MQAPSPEVQLRGRRTGKGSGERGSPGEAMEREGPGEQPPESCLGNAGLTPRPHTRGEGNGAVEGRPPAAGRPPEGPRAGEMRTHCTGFENGADEETTGHRKLLRSCGLSPAGSIPE